MLSNYCKLAKQQTKYFTEWWSGAEKVNIGLGLPIGRGKYVAALTRVQNIQPGCNISHCQPVYTSAHYYCRGIQAYLIFVVFFTRTKFLESKIYTEKTRKLQQNTQKIANFLRYYGKIHSKLPIFRVKSAKIYTGQKKIYTRILVAFVTNIRYGPAP